MDTLEKQFDGGQEDAVEVEEGDKMEVFLFCSACRNERIFVIDESRKGIDFLLTGCCGSISLVHLNSVHMRYATRVSNCDFLCQYDGSAGDCNLMNSSYLLLGDVSLLMTHHRPCQQIARSNSQVSTRFNGFHRDACLLGFGIPADRNCRGFSHSSAEASHSSNDVIYCRPGVAFDLHTCPIYPLWNDLFCHYSQNYAAGYVPSTQRNSPDRYDYRSGYDSRDSCILDVESRITKTPTTISLVSNDVTGSLNEWSELYIEYWQSCSIPRRTFDCIRAGEFNGMVDTGKDFNSQSPSLLTLCRHNHDRLGGTHTKSEVKPLVNCAKRPKKSGFTSDSAYCSLERQMKPMDYIFLRAAKGCIGDLHSSEDGEIDEDSGTEECSSSDSEDTLIVDATTYTREKLNQRTNEMLSTLRDHFERLIQEVSEQLVKLLQERHELKEQVDMRKIAIEQLVRFQANTTQYSCDTLQRDIAMSVED